MSAVLQDAPQQLGIEGLAAAEDSEVGVAMSGRLARRAMLRISPDGRAHLTVEVRQAGNKPPFVACYHGLPGEVPQLEDMAHRFHAGTCVLVRGDGVEIESGGADCTRPDVPRLRVAAVRYIREIAFDNFNHDRVSP